MSRILAWRRFLEVRFEDDNTQPLEAFAVRATADTRERLTRYRLIARPIPSGLAIYYRVFPDLLPTLRGPITSRVRFSFTMHLRDTDFFTRFEPDLVPATGANLQLDNLDEAGAILADGASLSIGATVSVADAVQIGRRALPLTVNLNPSPPTHVRALHPLTGAAFVPPVQALVEPLTGAASFSTTLQIPETADPLVRVVEVPAGPLDRRAYADDSVTVSGAIGVIDLYWETAQDTVPVTTGQVYRAVFERR